jgi:hypothetical protein
MNDIMPFEFRALEVILQGAITSLYDEADDILPQLEHFLQSHIAIHNVDKDMLTTLLHYSKLITRFDMKVAGVRNALLEVLNSGNVG